MTDNLTILKPIHGKTMECWFYKENLKITLISEKEWGKSTYAVNS